VGIRLRRPRFEELSEEWLDELEAVGKSGETLRAYRSDLKLWNDSGLDPVSYLLALSGEGAKPSTVNRRRAVLRSYHTWLVDKGLIDENPVDRAKMVKSPRRLQRTLTVEEVAKLIDSAGQLGKQRNRNDNVVHLGHMPIEHYRTRLAAMIAMQVTAGLRVSEVCDVPLEHVDLERRTIRVIRKGDKEQQLRFGMAAKRKVIEWMAHRAELSGPYLFCSADGQAVLPRSYTRQLHEACWWAGLDPIHPHTLRHTFATLAIESGIPVADVQQMLGHENIQTTMGYVNRHPDRGFDRYESHPLADDAEQEGTSPA
jgi:site-specific recombinase XerD